MLDSLGHAACQAFVDGLLCHTTSRPIKSRKILICAIFAILGNYQGRYFSSLIKLLNNEIAENLELHDWILAKWDQWQPFLKRPKVQRSCGKKSAKKVPKSLSIEWGQNFGEIEHINPHITKPCKSYLPIQWNLIIKRSDITKPSYNMVNFLVPSLYISLFLEPDITRNLI